MKKVEPMYYQPKVNDLEIRNYDLEMLRITNEIKKMNDYDFQILINTDIPFRCEYIRTWKQPFCDYLNDNTIRQKGIYILFLRNVFIFPQFTFQRN